GHSRDLHSFPTRRSSDLGGAALGVERHDLAIEDDRLFQTLRPRLKRIRDFGELGGFFVAEPRPQAYTAAARRDLSDGPDAVVLRSEEHTSELQSRSDLVC